jgi:glycosyltransferase involved in cell wall biosynthesis
VNKDEDDDIDIYVSDNASDDNTEEVVRNMMREYEFIRYFRNDISVPPDQNFQKALLLPDTDYVWLLGDTYTIPDGTLACVRETLSNSQYDLIIVNVSNRVTDVDEQVFTDKNKLLSDLGWHMTCLSTLIFSRELLKKTDFSRYRDTNFLQTGIIFEYLADKPIKVKWIPQHSVLGIDVPGVKKKSWEGQTFEIWTKRWANFVFSLPAAYSLDAKMKCIMDHGFKSKVFTLSALKHLRRKGILNLETYRNYSRYFPLTIKYPPLLIRLLAMLPRSVTRLF